MTDTIAIVAMCRLVYQAAKGTGVSAAVELVQETNIRSLKSFVIEAMLVPNRRVISVEFVSRDIQIGTNMAKLITDN